MNAHKNAQNTLIIELTIFEMQIYPRTCIHAVTHARRHEHADTNIHAHTQVNKHTLFSNRHLITFLRRRPLTSDKTARAVNNGPLNLPDTSGTSASPPPPISPSLRLSVSCRILLPRPGVGVIGGGACPPLLRRPCQGQERTRF